MGMISMILDTESLEYDPVLAKQVLSSIRPESTIHELFEAIRAVKRAYETGLLNITN